MMVSENKLVQEALDATEDVMDLTAPPESVLLVELQHLRVLRQAAGVAQDAYNQLVELTEQSQRVKAESDRLDRRTRRLMRTCFVLLAVTGALIIFHTLQIFGVV